MSDERLGQEQVHAHRARMDIIDRLVIEVERLRNDNERLRGLPDTQGAVMDDRDVFARLAEAQDKAARLRGLLARLQWAGTYACESRPGCGQAACPVCGVLADSPAVGQLPHMPDCWLAAALGRT